MMIKRVFSTLLVLLALVSCKEEKNINPATQLQPKEQENFKYAVSRYVIKAPKKVTLNTRFTEVNDAHYKEEAQKSDLLYYYKDDESNTVYFAITKIAPSLKLKKNATVGKLKYDDKGEISEYEEGFRTWKMEEPELKKKTEMLFKKYIDGDDVSEYYTKNSKGELYIEFPDDMNYYDKPSRSWKTKETQF